MGDTRLTPMSTSGKVARFFLLNDAYSGDSRSQEHEQWSSRGRVNVEDRESNGDEERDWYVDRERDNECDLHHGDHKDRSDRMERERDRVDDHESHQRRCRSEDHDRDRHRHRSHHRQDYDGCERPYSRDVDDYDNPHSRDYDSDYGRESECRHRHGSRSRSNRDYSRESERHHRHRSRSRSRDVSKHVSRSQPRSRSKSSKRISRFDLPPPVAMPNVAVPGQVPGSTPAVSGILSNLSPLALGQIQLPTLPLMPVQSMTLHVTRHARRVYVGGLYATANEQSVANFFSHAMSAIGGNTAGPGDAVVNVYINSEKKFAFVEMRSVEEASNAMALDGIIFEGAPVKVRRPSDYNPSWAAALGPNRPDPNLNLAAVGLLPVSSIGGLDGPDRIFICGLPYHFTDAQVRELLQSFGPLRGFDLVRDRETGISKGYAFCVYQDLSVTDIACAALDGIILGGKRLTARRASQGIAQLRPEQENVLLEAQQQVAAIQRVVFQMGSLPTKIICITQVVSADELRDDEEFEEILDDMKGEGGKYGNLVKVVIPRPGPDGEAAPGVGRIFLEYEDMEGSKKARLGLHGRKFDGRQAVAIFYDENKYAKGEYDG